MQNVISVFVLQYDNENHPQLVTHKLWIFYQPLCHLYANLATAEKSNVHLLSAGQEREQTQGRTSEVVDTKSRIVEVTQPDPCGGTPTDAAGAALNPTKVGSSSTGTTGTTGKY